ncbi:MAG: hypothetical protein JWM42_2322 [Burkholderia sp.]|nr:hypothetical protein [Burkholderia sp.]
MFNAIILSIATLVSVVMLVAAYIIVLLALNDFDNDGNLDSQSGSR